MHAQGPEGACTRPSSAPLPCLPHRLLRHPAPAFLAQLPKPLPALLALGRICACACLALSALMSRQLRVTE